MRFAQVQCGRCGGVSCGPTSLPHHVIGLCCPYCGAVAGWVSTVSSEKKRKKESKDAEPVQQGT
jgi:hypothetical protein